MKLIRIHPVDNVAVALENLTAGEAVTVDGSGITAAVVLKEIPSFRSTDGPIRRGFLEKRHPITLGYGAIKSKRGERRNRFC